MKIDIDQVPCEVIKAWVINDMLSREEADNGGFYSKHYFVDFDNLRYEFNGEWFVYTEDDLQANLKFQKDYQLAKSYNLKLKLGLLKSDFTSKTKDDFESEEIWRELTRTYARTLIAENQND